MNSAKVRSKIWIKTIKKMNLPFDKHSKAYRSYCLGKKTLKQALEYYSKACERHESDYDSAWIETWPERKEHASMLLKEKQAISWNDALRQANIIWKYKIRDSCNIA